MRQIKVFDSEELLNEFLEKISQYVVEIQYSTCQNAEGNIVDKFMIVYECSKEEYKEVRSWIFLSFD